MSLAKISLALTCYRAQYPAAIYARRVRATCPRHRSHPDSISIYSHSIPEIAKCKVNKCKLKSLKGFAKQKGINDLMELFNFGGITLI